MSLEIFDDLIEFLLCGLSGLLVLVEAGEVGKSRCSNSAHIDGCGGMPTLVLAVRRLGPSRGALLGRSTLFV